MRATAIRRPAPRLRTYDINEPASARALGNVGLIGAATSAARRLLGLALLAMGLFLALSLWGYDPRDPSFSNTTSAPVSNPAGPSGAWIADLLYQFFGYASLLLVVAILAWGVRLVLDRRLAWPWLPFLALPLSLLAGSAFLASRAGAATRDLAVPRRHRRLRRRLPVPTRPAGARDQPLCLGQRRAGVAARRRPRSGCAGANPCGSPVASPAASHWLGRNVGRVAVVAGTQGGRVMAEGWRDLRDRSAGANDNGKSRPTVESVPAWRDRVAKLLPWRRPAEDQGEVRSRRHGVERRPTPSRRPRPPNRRRRARMRPLRTAAESPPPTTTEPPPERREPKVTSTQREPSTPFELPVLDLLARPKTNNGISLTKAQLSEVSRQLETVLDDFGVRGEIVDTKPGPVVTLFELEPAPGTRAARVISLADDIARSTVRSFGTRRCRARPQRDRHRAAQRAARHRLSA